MTRSPLAALAAIGLLLGACSSLPEAGPSTAAMAPGKLPYPVVEIDAASATSLARPEAAPAARFPKAPAVVGLDAHVGDVLSVAFFAPQAGGLFGADGYDAAHPSLAGAPGSRAYLPAVTVGPDGMISLPYAGRVRAAGLPLHAIEGEVERRLAGQMIDPQVFISLAKPEGTLVSVEGEMGQGTRFALRVQGDDVLEAIAAAGGPKAPAYETVVHLIRNGKDTALRLERIIEHPSEDVALRPGDVLMLTRNPETFTALGAVGHVGEIDFGAAELTLAEALGKAGGPLDYRADPSGVYVLRMHGAPGGGPVVYHLDMRKGTSLALAQAVAMRNKDVLYVSNAPIVEVEKALGVVGAAFNATGAGAVLNATGN